MILSRFMDAAIGENDSNQWREGSYSLDADGCWSLRGDNGSGFLVFIVPPALNNGF